MQLKAIKVKDKTYEIKSYDTDINQVNTKINKIETQVNDIETKVNDIDTRVDIIENPELKFFETHNTKVHYIIDQRGEISDSDTMVSENFVFDDSGNKVFIPEEYKHNPRLSCLGWLRANSHAYVTRYWDDNLLIKQLDDSNRKRFADGSSSVNFIKNINYDVMMKIDSDVYWKTEPYTPDNETAPNEDYILVTIARKLSATDNEVEWQKWPSTYLVAVYESSKTLGLHSTSGEIVHHFTSKNIPSLEKRGNFTFIDYNFCCLFTYLFYGWYSTLDSIKQCGGAITSNYDKTGYTDDLAGIDTTPNTCILGHNNFWHIEDFQGKPEYVGNITYMPYSRSSNETTSDPNTYLKDYIDQKGYPIITKYGKDYQLTEDDFTKGSAANKTYYAIKDLYGNIKRIIQHDDYSGRTFGGYVSKLRFGKYADILFKNITTQQDTFFVSYDYYQLYYNPVGVFVRGNQHVLTSLRTIVYNNPDNISTRLMYAGTKFDVQTVTTF